MYTPNNRVSNYTRQKLIELQGETDESTIIIGNVNIPLSDMNRYSRDEISKDLVELNTINQLDIMDIYGLLYPTTTQYTFFSSSHRTFAKTDHILGHKTHFHKLKRIEIIQCLLSDHNGITLEINKRKTTGKCQKEQSNHQQSTLIQHAFVECLLHGMSPGARTMAVSSVHSFPDSMISISIYTVNK